jgi:hypothetical protein
MEPRPANTADRDSHGGQQPRLGGAARRSAPRAGARGRDRARASHPALRRDPRTMARIESGSVQRTGPGPLRGDRRSSDCTHGAAADRPDIRMEASDDVAVEIDPRLTSLGPRALDRECRPLAGRGPVVVKGWTDDEGSAWTCSTPRRSSDIRAGAALATVLSREQVPSSHGWNGMGLAITRG